MKHSRRSFLHANSAMSAAMLLPNTSWFFNYLAAAPGEMTLLRKQVGIYTERGGTMGWFIDQKESAIVVIDSQFPEQATNCITLIREQLDRPIDYLVNTHHHGDHSGGNIAFKDIARHVLAHENSKANQERVAKEGDREATQLYPNRIYDKKWSEPIGSEQLTLYYFGPAHTNGDSLIHFENANVVHLGDLLFNRRFPFIDRSSGASIENWIRVLDKARQTFDKDTIYIFGHCREGLQVTGTEEDLKAKQQFLESLLTYAGRAVKNGMSKEELLENAPETIPGAPEWKGRGIERPLGAAWEELVNDE